jgi:uracil-DNA glycosylase
MLATNTWPDLKYWQSGEWQVIQERLDGYDPDSDTVNPIECHPSRELLFAALDAVPIDKVKVAIIGQDPYPDKRFATGHAFSIPKTEKKIPVTLANILKEYCSDLHLPFPDNGDLTPWVRQGVLLWNAIPSVGSKPLSHNWVEWTWLTKEIIETLNQRAIVFLAMGSLAREFCSLYTTEISEVVAVSHPSPRGKFKGWNPFVGSRCFSTVNDKLVERGLDPIDWRLK